MRNHVLMPQTYRIGFASQQVFNAGVKLKCNVVICESVKKRNLSESVKKRNLS